MIWQELRIYDCSLTKWITALISELVVLAAKDSTGVLIIDCYKMLSKKKANKFLLVWFNGLITQLLLCCHTLTFLPTAWLPALVSCSARPCSSYQQDNKKGFKLLPNHILPSFTVAQNDAWFLFFCNFPVTFVPGWSEAWWAQVWRDNLLQVPTCTCTYALTQ